MKSVARVYGSTTHAPTVALLPAGEPTVATPAGHDQVPGAMRESGRRHSTKGFPMTIQEGSAPGVHSPEASKSPESPADAVRYAAAQRAAPRYCEQYLSPREQFNEILGALAELGVLKPGEEARTLHAHRCPFREAACTCPQGPELLFADWDECIPTRYQPTPERFYVRH
jgi:hypothetical protein